jgi:hypothetical protein
MSANGILIDTYNGGIQLSVRTKLNLRDGPSRTAALVGRRQPPDLLVADQLVDAEAFLDNSYWFRQAGTGHFFWAGGVERILNPPQLPSAPPANVARRADGTIKPCTASELDALYGPLVYTSQSNGAIILGNNWESLNIVDFHHPLLAQMQLKRLRVHRNALAAFTGVFDAIAQAGAPVSDCLRTCAGTFVPRHIGWNPARALSSHSWGVAIDLNAQWNGYGARPAMAGQFGSIREVVPYFAQFGFAWGGHFSGASSDGMHFELALK